MVSADCAGGNLSFFLLLPPLPHSLRPARCSVFHSWDSGRGARPRREGGPLSLLAMVSGAGRPEIKLGSHQMRVAAVGRGTRVCALELSRRTLTGGLKGPGVRQEAGSTAALGENLPLLPPVASDRRQSAGDPWDAAAGLVTGVSIHFGRARGMNGPLLPHL